MGRIVVLALAVYVSCVVTWVSAARVSIRKHSESEEPLGLNKSMHCKDALQPILRSLQVKELFAEVPDFWKEVLIWPGGPQWGTVLTEEAYKFEENRLINLLGRLEHKAIIHGGERALSSRRFLEEKNSLTGMCNMALATQKALTHSPVLLGYLQSSLSASGSPVCGHLSLTEMAADAAKALESLCLDGCLHEIDMTIARKTQDFKTLLYCGQVVFDRPFFKELFDYSEECAKLPFDTVEGLTEYAMQQRCYAFVPPSALWLPNDKSPGDLGQFGEQGACALSDVQKELKRMDVGKDHPFVRHGTCPSGTTCSCPITSIRDRQTTPELRKTGEWLFIKRGDASAPSILKHYALGFAISTVVLNMAIGGLAFGAATLASLEAPLFLLVGSVVAGVRAGVHYHQFHCEQTIGCWPQRPAHVAVNGTPKACRLPEEASAGGSLLWFLPPPGTHLHHHYGSCIVAPCKPEDTLIQLVGLGDSSRSRKYPGVSNVYNCQPLNFEDMSGSQKSLMIDRLQASGIGEEYSDAFKLAVGSISMVTPSASAMA